MTSLVQTSYHGGITLPRPPDSARPVGLQNNVRRRSQIMSSSYPDGSGRSSVRSASSYSSTQPGPNRRGPATTWDTTTAQQTRGVSQASANSPFLSTLLQASGGGSVIGSRGLRKKQRQSCTKPGAKPLSPMRAAGPAACYGKSVEEMYDEIIQLKKVLHITAAERDVCRGKVLRFEKDMLKKDKQIEDLLAAGHIPSRDMTRSLVEKKASLSATILSLRQQVHSFEAQLKEKEKIISAMTQDIRSTSLQELEIQANTYYAEVARLQKVVERQAAALQSATPRNLRNSETRLKALNDAVRNLSDELLEATQSKAALEKEVVELRRRAGSLPSSSHKEKGERAAVADKHMDLNRDQMISSLVDLEMAVKVKDRKVSKLQAELTSQQESNQQEIDALKEESSLLKDNTVSLEGKSSEEAAYKEKLRKLIKQLKDDRNHYRTLADQTQVELEKMRADRQEQSRQAVSLQGELSSTQQSLENEEVARRHAQELAQRTANIFLHDKKKTTRAAEIVQNAWKRWRSKKRQQKYEDDLNSVAEDIQAVLRGHAARQKYLSSSAEPLIDENSLSDDSSCDSGQEEAITTIQAAFRGHLSRITAANA